jgi:hypothetical protein
MVYKKLQRLAGFTARVVELLESVDRQVRPLLLSVHFISFLVFTLRQFISSHQDVKSDHVVRHDGNFIKFENISINTPDGRFVFSCSFALRFI